MSQNSLVIKKGQVILNGKQLTDVKDLQIHVQNDGLSEVKIDFFTTSLDASFSELNQK
mgnify:CR=1 FL=1